MILDYLILALDYLIVAIVVAAYVPTIELIVLLIIFALPAGVAKILIDFIKWYRKGAWA